MLEPNIGQILERMPGIRESGLHRFRIERRRRVGEYGVAGDIEGVGDD